MLAGRADIRGSQAGNKAGQGTLALRPQQRARTMRIVAPVVLHSLLISLVLGPAAVAQREGFDHFRGDHDIHHFHEHDLMVWRGGHWFHGPHGGRDGWWWIVDGSWYFYPAPIYPYPDPYAPPEMATPAPGAPPTWYFCPNPQGYYPYVQQCPTPWQPMPAQPQ